MTLISSIIFECPHKPQIVKKIGKVFGEYCEILVCHNCKNHPDLKNFQEEAL